MLAGEADLEISHLREARGEETGRMSAPKPGVITVRYSGGTYLARHRDTGKTCSCTESPKGRCAAWQSKTPSRRHRFGSE